MRLHCNSLEPIASSVFRAFPTYRVTFLRIVHALYSFQSSLSLFLPLLLALHILLSVASCHRVPRHHYY